MFHTRGPAAAKHRSPKLLFERRTTHPAVSVDRSRRQARDVTLRHVCSLYRMIHCQSTCTMAFCIWDQRKPNIFLLSIRLSRAPVVGRCHTGRQSIGDVRTVRAHFPCNCCPAWQWLHLAAVTQRHNSRAWRRCSRCSKLSQYSVSFHSS